VYIFSWLNNHGIMDYCLNDICAQRAKKSQCFEKFLKKGLAFI